MYQHEHTSTTRKCSSCEPERTASPWRAPPLRAPAADRAPPQRQHSCRQPHQPPWHSPLWAGPTLPARLPHAGAALCRLIRKTKHKREAATKKTLACRVRRVLCRRLSSLPPPLLGAAPLFPNGAALLLPLQLRGLPPLGKRHLLWRIIICRLVCCSRGGCASPHVLPSSPTCLGSGDQAEPGHKASPNQRDGQATLLILAGCWPALNVLRCVSSSWCLCCVPLSTQTIWQALLLWHVQIADVLPRAGQTRRCTTDQHTANVSYQLSAGAWRTARRVK